MDKNEEFHDLFSSGVDDVFRVSVALKGLADAFNRTGNVSVAEELRFYAEQLQTASSDLRKAEIDRIGLSIKETQKGIATIFQAILQK